MDAVNDERIVFLLASHRDMECVGSLVVGYHRVASGFKPVSIDTLHLDDRHRGIDVLVFSRELGIERREQVGTDADTVYRGCRQRYLANAEYLQQVGRLGGDGSAGWCQCQRDQRGVARGWRGQRKGAVPIIGYLNTLSSSRHTAIASVDAERRCSLAGGRQLNQPVAAVASRRLLSGYGCGSYRRIMVGSPGECR